MTTEIDEFNHLNTSSGKEMTDLTTPFTQQEKERERGVYILGKKTVKLAGRIGVVLLKGMEVIPQDLELEDFERLAKALVHRSMDPH